MSEGRRDFFLSAFYQLFKSKVGRTKTVFTSKHFMSEGQCNFCSIDFLPALQKGKSVEQKLRAPLHQDGQQQTIRLFLGRKSD
jgi:hypothetical protein